MKCNNDCQNCDAYPCVKGQCKTMDELRAEFIKGHCPDCKAELVDGAVQYCLICGYSRLNKELADDSKKPE